MTISAAWGRNRAREIRFTLLLFLCLTAATRPLHSQEAARRITLREVLDSVRDHHPLVAAARARVRAARGSRTTAGTFGNPILSYQVDDTRFPGGKPVPLDAEHFSTATLPLEPLYQRGPRMRRADAEIAAAEAEEAATLRQVSLDATRSYYRQALAQVNVAVSRDLSAWLDTLVTYNTARAREGVAAEADLLRSQLERDRASADLSLNEADLARANAELLSFLGDQGETSETLLVAQPDQPLPAAFAATSQPALLEMGFAVRPEIRAGERRVAAASAGIASERSMFVRQVGATFGVKKSAGINSMIAGISLPFPLFDQNRGEIARATAQREAASFELASARRSVRAEIVGAVRAASILRQRMTNLQPGYLARADEARRITLAAYREGGLPLIQVLDAARAWGEARRSYYQLLYAQHQSVFELNGALGRDLLLGTPPTILP